MTTKNASRTKGRTARAPRCFDCGGAARPGHASTSKHRDALRVRSNRAYESGLAQETRTYRTPSREREDDYHRERAQVERLQDWLDYCATTEPEYPDGMARITLTEAARRLGRSPITLRSAQRRGKLVAHKEGRDWFVEESEVRYYELTSLGRVGWPKGRPRRKSA